MEPATLREKPFLTLLRRYPVTPEKVWRAWTDPQALKRWWAPSPGEPVSAAELDVRVGGHFRIVFGGADGTAHECAGVYKEVVTNRRLVFTFSWPRTTPERVSLVTIEFHERGGQTELIFRHEGLFDEKVRDAHEEGWGCALDGLARFLADLPA